MSSLSPSSMLLTSIHQLQHIIHPSDPIFFFLNAPAPPEISPLPLPDALPISQLVRVVAGPLLGRRDPDLAQQIDSPPQGASLGHALMGQHCLGDLEACLEDRVQRAHRRSEEHTSELQSQSNLVCRLLLEHKHPTIPANGPPPHAAPTGGPPRVRPPNSDCDPFSAG